MRYNATNANFEKKMEIKVSDIENILKNVSNENVNELKRFKKCTKQFFQDNNVSMMGGWT